MKRRATPGRWRALLWFADHERDPALVLMRKRPSTRMLGIMLREGQLYTVRTNISNHSRWMLSDAGRELLAAKHRRHCHEQT
jgi:hypothetical protein